MLTLRTQSRFKKDAKKYQYDKKASAAILRAIELLKTGQPVPSQYREHLLIGEYVGCLECHCLSDVLLIYERTATELIVHRVGSHSEVFR